jgi:hypothetical protein
MIEKVQAQGAKIDAKRTTPIPSQEEKLNYGLG